MSSSESSPATSYSPPPEMARTDTHCPARPSDPPQVRWPPCPPQTGSGHVVRRRDSTPTPFALPSYSSPKLPALPPSPPISPKTSRSPRPHRQVDRGMPTPASDRGGRRLTSPIGPVTSVYGRTYHFLSRDARGTFLRAVRDDRRALRAQLTEAGASGARRARGIECLLRHARADDAILGEMVRELQRDMDKLRELTQGLRHDQAEAEALLAKLKASPVRQPIRVKLTQPRKPSEPRAAVLQRRLSRPGEGLERDERITDPTDVGDQGQVDKRKLSEHNGNPERNSHSEESLQLNCAESLGKRNKRKRLSDM